MKLKLLKLNILLICLFSHQLLAKDKILEELKVLARINQEMLAENFTTALAIIDSLGKENPNSPVSYFARGGYYNFLTDFYEIADFEKEIDKNYQKAIELSEDKISISPWYSYFIGASKANSSYQERRMGNMFSALSRGISAISYIEDCLDEDPENYDAQLIYGSYLFYKYNTAMMNLFVDKRDEGIRIVKKSIEKSLFSKSLAIVSLMWILFDYEKYDEAIAAGKLGLKDFPNSRYFLWGIAKSYYRKKNYSKAKEIYLKILKQVENDSINSNFNKFNLFYRLSYSNYYLGNSKESLKFLLKANALKLTDREEERLEDLLDDLEDLEDLKE